MVRFARRVQSNPTHRTDVVAGLLSHDLLRCVGRIPDAPPNPVDENFDRGIEPEPGEGRASCLRRRLDALPLRKVGVYGVHDDALAGLQDEPGLPQSDS